MKSSIRNQNSSLYKSSLKGFTLIELLVVMAIIITLAGIGFGTYLMVTKSAKEKETELMITNVAQAMEARSADISSKQRTAMGALITAGFTYPDGDASAGSTEPLIRYISGDFDGDGNIDTGAKTKLPEVVPGESGSGFYLNADGRIVDSWGTPIRYTFPGVYHNEDNGFDLESAGPDREFGSGPSDDLSRDNIILE